MFVKIKIFGENRKILAESALQRVFLKQRFDIRSFRNFKIRCFIFTIVFHQPILYKKI